jgi:quercetin dioxygenase-like cupin family protein
VHGRDLKLHSVAVALCAIAAAGCGPGAGFAAPEGLKARIINIDSYVVRPRPKNWRLRLLQREDSGLRIMVRHVQGKEDQYKAYRGAAITGYVIRGPIVLDLGPKSKPLRLTQGMVFILPKGAPHRLLADTHGKVLLHILGKGPEQVGQAAP